MVFNAMSLNDSKKLSLELFNTHLAEAQHVDCVNDEEILDKKGPIVFSSKLPTLKQATDLLIREAIKRADGNQSRAGRMLGISQQAVSKRLKGSGIKGQG
jgi:DNA-binding NtrC family response regulator